MRFRSFALALAFVITGLSSLPAQQAAAGRPGSKDILITLRNAGNFTLFLQAIEAAGMSQQLRTAGPFTVFAPTDDAFGRVAGPVRDSLFRDRAMIEVVVRNHLLEGRVTADEARTRRGLSFMGGTAVKVDATGTLVRVNGAQVIKANMVASNGLIHAVDQVWMPTVNARVRGTNAVDSAQRAPDRPRPRN
jgi:uncharacterized surface protein with fasciclin (FAS1) repeats